MVTAQRSALVAAALHVGVLVSASANASESVSSGTRRDFVPGLSVGARLGFGFPLGDRATVGSVPESMGPSGNYSGLFPIWVDAGYRATKLAYLGGYFQYGILTVAKEHGCPAPLTSCSAHDLRAGAAVHFHFMPDSAADLWAGLGIGYEASSITFENGIQSAKRSNGGIEFANLQLGVDFHPIFGLDWGPFASFSIDEYTTETHTPPVGPSETYALTDKTIHYFLVLGMRVQCDF